MAALTGELASTLARDNYTGSFGRYVSQSGYQASNAMVVVVGYMMAAFDNNGLRYYWTNGNKSFDNAPTPSGAGTYVVNTLVVEGAWSISALGD